MTDYLDEKFKLSHRLQGLANGLGEQIAESLEGSLDLVVGKILRLSAEAEQTESVIRKKKYLEKQKAEIEKVLNEVYAEIGKTIKATAIEVALETPEIVNSISKATLKIQLAVPKLDKKTVESWFEATQVDGLYFPNWLKKLESNAVARIIKESRTALILTGTKTDAVKNIQNALNVSKRSARALAQNAIYTMHNYAELEDYKANSDIISKVRFEATLDRRTTPLCIQLDGKIFNFNDAPIPPLHWNCRSSLVPVFSEKRVEAVKGTRIARLDTEGRTVHHRDGTTSTKYKKMRPQTVPDTMNYNQWMKSLINSKNPADVSFAREALGKTRFKLVASGKLKLESLYYQGKLRSIKELRKLI
ncbi:MAG: minor capsid protein [Planctomycetota bacterium]|jgi:SPP1 gp7 family putative phage head morphogenesis protein